MVIHTETEFDWHSDDFSYSSIVRHGEKLLRLCYELIEMDIKIILAVDYAFALSEEGNRVIEQLKLYKGNIAFATHMHPWNTPPFTKFSNEDEKQSFPGNLSYTNEFEKLSNITDLMEVITGSRPTIYLAGRYGIGKNTHSILRALGYEFDLSISAHSDFSLHGGPDFTEFDNQCFKIDNITYIPHTVGFISNNKFISNLLNKHKTLHKRLNSNVVGKIFLNILGVKRVRLSTEGFNFEELTKVTDSLIWNKTEYLLFSMHSSSLTPGVTYYTKNKTDCETLHKNSLEIIKFLVDKHSLSSSKLI